jgi:TetR/AcrR family transcriptional regulator, ethionamide resistance regulator
MAQAALPQTRRVADREGPATKGDRREQAILDALESLLTEYPLASVSIARIAERAGVGRTAFYFYFSSREAALAALAQRSVAPVYVAAQEWLYGDEDPLAELDRGLRAVVDLWIEQAHLFVALIDAASHDLAMFELWREQIEGLVRAVSERIERDSRRGLTWPGIDAGRTARALAWMTERYCYMYVPQRHSGGLPRDEVIDALRHVWQRSIYPGA